MSPWRGTEPAGALTRRGGALRTVLAVAPALAGLALMSVGAGSQQVGRTAAERLEVPPLVFDPPEPREHTVRGVPVLFLEDPALPLVNVHARFEGGSSYFPRGFFAAATAVPLLLRSSGTAELAPDSVDALVEHYALQTVFGGGGEGSYSSLNTLREHLDPGLALWGDMLRSPRFAPELVEVWRGQELDRIRRRGDDPGSLAFGAFNRVVFGDHPIGWQMEAADLEPEDLTPERLRWVHGRVFCPANLVLGVTGDVRWEEIEPLLDRMLAGWPACPEPLPEPPVPEMRTEPGVFLIPRELTQSTVVMAHPGGIRQAPDRDYFASRIGNSILGAGGFSSRLMSRLRTREGLAYTASSLWTAPSSREGLVGAVTSTRSDATVAATKLILETIGEMTREPPREEEVRTTVDEIANGFVFNFETPSQIVSRQMLYRAEGMPGDWLERFLEGIRSVTPEDVRGVFRRHVRPEDMIILIVGDPDAFDEPPEVLGPVTVLAPDGSVRAPGAE